MREKDAAKIVLASAAAGVLFTGLLAFRVVKGMLLLGQCVLHRQEKQTFQDKDKSPDQ